MKKLLRGMVAVAVLMMSMLMPNKGVEAKPTEPKSPTIQETKKTTPLFLQHARDLFEKKTGDKYCWHSSHVSHVSHASHQSHASHRSHYSGW